jgi:hypothetical protein
MPIVATGQTAAAAQEKAKAKKKNTKPKTTNTPEEDVASNPPANTAGIGSKTSLSGLPLGMEIKTGKISTQYVGRDLIQGAPVYNKVQYTQDSPYQIVATKNNQEKANLLLALAAIPGLYSKGQAPTTDFIRQQGNAISFRPEDYKALTNVMIHADSTGQTYDKSLITFVQNPGLAQQYFGSVSGAGGRAIALSRPEELKAELAAKFMDLFDIAPDDKIAKAYIKDVNKAELAAKGGITQQEKENIFLKYVEQTANQRYKAAALTPGEEDDIALEAGSLGTVIKQIRSAYANNGIATSEKKIYSDALKGIRSQQALANTLNMISVQAITQFPAFKQQILDGATVKDLLDPYVPSFQKIYGRLPKPSDLYEVAAGTNAIPVAEWELLQWKKPEIKQTNFYKDTINSDIRSMAEAFGAMI